jgi:hypothetical protein
VWGVDTFGSPNSEFDNAAIGPAALADRCSAACAQISEPDKRKLRFEFRQTEGIFTCGEIAAQDSLVLIVRTTVTRYSKSSSFIG